MPEKPLSPTAKTYYLDTSTLSDFSELLHQARATGWDPVKRLASEMSDAAREDFREIEAAGASDQDVADEQKRRLHRLVRELAVDAHADFLVDAGPEYTTAAVGRCVPDEALRLFETDPRSFRTLRLSITAMKQLALDARARIPGSRKEQEQLPGYAGDVFHAMAGAAYCDVFTCDQATARWVAPLRGLFGMPPPIVVGGHPGGLLGFVRELLAS